MIESVLTFLMVMSFADVIVALVLLGTVAGFLSGFIFIAVVMFLEDLDD